MPSRDASARRVGHESDRPRAAYLGDDVYELRVKHYRVNLRILYFFYGRTAVVLCHGLAKEKRVPKKDLRTAAERWRDSRPIPTGTPSTPWSE